MRYVARYSSLLLLLAGTSVDVQNVGRLSVNAVGPGWGYEGVYVTLTREITWAEAGTGSTVAVIPHNHTMRKDVTDIAKLALATGKPVSVYLEGGYGGGFMPKAAAIYRYPESGTDRSLG